MCTKMKWPLEYCDKWTLTKISLKWVFRALWWIMPISLQLWHNLNSFTSFSLNRPPPRELWHGRNKNWMDIKFHYHFAYTQFNFLFAKRKRNFVTHSILICLMCISVLMLFFHVHNLSIKGAWPSAQIEN